MKTLFSLTVPKGVQIRELEPLLTVTELLQLRSYRNPVVAERRRIERAQKHQERLRTIFAEHWGQP